MNFGTALERRGEDFPLEIENIGDDIYTLMSRGHHDPHEFMRKVREDGYTWPLGMPIHLWFRTTPDSTGDHVFIYNEAKPGARGAFPVTYATEAPYAELYDNLMTPNRS